MLHGIVFQDSADLLKVLPLTERGYQRTPIEKWYVQEVSGFFRVQYENPLNPTTTVDVALYHERLQQPKHRPHFWNSEAFALYCKTKEFDTLGRCKFVFQKCFEAVCNWMPEDRDQYNTMNPQDRD